MSEWKMPGELLDSERELMSKITKCTDKKEAEEMRINCFSAILHYISLYCVGEIPVSYHDANNVSFITGFNIRIDPEYLGRAFKIAFGEEVKVKPFIAIISLNLFLERKFQPTKISLYYSNEECDAPIVFDPIISYELKGDEKFYELGDILYHLIDENIVTTTQGTAEIKDSSVNENHQPSEDEMIEGMMKADCQKCHYERDDEGISIYYPSDWDNGIGFERGEAIFCPDCGRPLTPSARNIFKTRVKSSQIHITHS